MNTTHPQNEYNNQYSTITLENQQQQSQFQTVAPRVQTIVLQNDQNGFQGVLWGLAAFNLGAATASFAAMTIFTVGTYLQRTHFQFENLHLLVV